MGLGSWLDDKANGRAVAQGQKNLRELVAQCEADPARLRRYSELIAEVMESMWPRSGVDQIEYVVGVRQEIARMHPDQMFDMAYKMQKIATNYQNEGLAGAALGMNFLAEWINLLSIAEKRSGKHASSAAQVAYQYELTITDMLGEVATSASGDAAKAH